MCEKSKRLRSLFRKGNGDEENESRRLSEMGRRRKNETGNEPPEALRAVRLEQGTVEIAKKEIVPAALAMESFVRRAAGFALRVPAVANGPGFTIATVLTLALGSARLLRLLWFTPFY